MSFKVWRWMRMRMTLTVQILPRHTQFYTPCNHRSTDPTSSSSSQLPRLDSPTFAAPSLHSSPHLPTSPRHSSPDPPTSPTALGSLPGSQQTSTLQQTPGKMSTTISHIKTYTLILFFPMVAQSWSEQLAPVTIHLRLPLYQSQTPYWRCLSCSSRLTCNRW